MVFVPPSWVTGTMIWALFFVPILICVILFIYGIVKTFVYEDEGKVYLVFGSMIAIFLLFPVCFGGGGYIWHEMYEVPSVTEEIVNVSEWQVRPNVAHNKNGMMIIDNADQLMMITSDGRGFVNEENFLFQKFDTRDILNTMKPGGVYKIKYYGWREGYNSGFPNILSVEQVVDESNVTDVKLSDYFGSKLSGYQQ